MFKIHTAIIGSLMLAATTTSFANTSDIQAFENALAPTFQLAGKELQFNIHDRMKHHNVPAVSVALISDSKIAWAKAWGVEDNTKMTAATTGTLFQAASISKPVAAFTALRMTELGTLELNTPINKTLKSWKIGDNEFTRQQAVTLNHLLSHTAGTTVHGFPGYALDNSYPTTVQILDGIAPANTSAVYVDTAPGTAWRYSGGGYTVMQLAVEDVSASGFPDIAKQLTLAPLGMANSTFQTPLPMDAVNRIASGHRRDGVPVEGRYYVHPEMAAASLWTTPTDVAKFAVAVMDAWHGRPGALLPKATAQDMLTVRMNGYGLGFGLQLEENATIGFQHGGSNQGYRAYMIAFLNGQGAVVMTNSDNGMALIEEILSAAANLNAWPRFQSETKEWRPATKSERRNLTGTYRWRQQNNELVFTVQAEHDHFLISNSNNLQPTPFFIEASDQNTTNLFSQIGMTLSFTAGSDGTPVMHVWGGKAQKQK